MASRRKKHEPKGRPSKDEDMFTEFLSDVVTGTIKAQKLFIDRRGNRVEISYDEPDE